MIQARILVADDEPAQRELIGGFLGRNGFDVVEAADGVEAVERVRAGGIDLVLLDQRMPRLGGAEAVRALRETHPDVDVIVVTAYGSVVEAVEAMKLGAADYLTKPLDLDRLLWTVRKALERRTLLHENRELRRRLAGGPRFEGIVARGAAMREVLGTVARVAPTLATVLVTGESGTGKELIARAIHAASTRAAGPLVAVHTAALAEGVLESELFGHERGAFTGAERARTGRFEAAAGGTLFLDEIGDVPPTIQVKLLRAIQERSIERVGSHVPIPVDVRLVAATHRDLEAEIRAGRFREDLYYRLAVVRIDLPPLRRRREEIPALVDLFLRRHAADGVRRVEGISREAMDALAMHDWPGNVRELENAIESAIVLARGDLVTTDDLPPSVRARGESEGAGSGPDSLAARVAALERALIDEALRAEHGVQTRAAERLGISERALRYKLDRLGLR